MATTYTQAKEAIADRLSPDALAHCERVAATARELAELYGVDPSSAELAGLLHDWHKETPGDELLARARALGIPVSDVDEAVPYLLHAPVAAADIEREFPGIGEDVLTAIGSHTYGGDKMSRLSMIVYAADVLEPGRGHDGVQKLRSMVGKVSLEELYAEVYAAGLRHLVNKRRRIHPQTVESWNRIVSGAGK